MTKLIIRLIAISFSIALGTPLSAIAANSESTLTGTLLIAGNGPERHLLVLLAQEFEKQHPSVSIDLFVLLKKISLIRRRHRAIIQSEVYGAQLHQRCHAIYTRRNPTTVLTSIAPRS